MHLRGRFADTAPQQDDETGDGQRDEEASPCEEDQDCAPWRETRPGGFPVDSTLWQQHDGYERRDGGWWISRGGGILRSLDGVGVGVDAGGRLSLGAPNENKPLTERMRPQREGNRGEGGGVANLVMIREERNKKRRCQWTLEADGIAGAAKPDRRYQGCNSTYNWVCKVYL